MTIWHTYGLAYIMLEKDGRTFHGLPSAPNVVRQVAYVHDLLPSSPKPETLRLALDVAVCYNRGSNLNAFAFLIRQGDTVLEVGAFSGSSSTLVRRAGRSRRKSDSHRDDA